MASKAYGYYGYRALPTNHKFDETDPSVGPPDSGKRHYTIQKNTDIQGLLNTNVKGKLTDSPDSSRIQGRLKKESDFPRLGGWVRVRFEGKMRISTTLAVNEKTVKVKILDSMIHPRHWKVCEFPKTDLERPIYHCAESLAELMGVLKETGTLQSGVIEDAFYAVDRRHFCSKNFYWDAAIDIGFDMCISTPHMHIWVLEMLKDLFDDATSILDIGSGSGHLTALLAHLAPRARVIGIDIIPQLVDQAHLTVQNNVAKETSKRIVFKLGDGELGFDSGDSYDIIHVGFMCDNLPSSLVDQIKPGGKMIVPIGTEPSYFDQRMRSGHLTLVEKNLHGKVELYPLFWCSYVPSKSAPKSIQSG